MSGDERADTLVDERELAAALRGLRADPADFRAAVERRIREAETKAREAGAAGPDGSELRADASWWRRAAGWLPPELVPGALAAGGAKLSWKVLFGLLALPALTFAMLVTPIVLALQSLGSQADERRKERAAVVRGWWLDHKQAALVTLVVLGVLFVRAPAGAGAALLLVSTGVLAMLLVRLRAAGFGRREDVARHCASLLVSLMIWMTMFGGPWKQLFPSGRSQHFATFALMAGGAVCAATALRANHRTLWSLVTRSKTADALLLLQVAVFAPLSVMSMWAGVADLAHVDLVQNIEQLRPPRDDAWDQARKAIAHLHRTGVDPDLTGLREHWLRAREEDVHDHLESFLAAGIELGFVDEETRESLADARRWWLDLEGPIPGGSLREHAGLLALVRSKTLTPAERERLGQRLLASRDSGPNLWVFERLATVANLLDELGLHDQADGLLPDAHALLRRYWVYADGPFWSNSGFTAPPLPTDTIGFDPSTVGAIELMCRFGAPSEIDLPSLRRALRHYERGLPWQRPGSYLSPSRLALSELEHELLSHRSWLATLGENVVLLALFVLSIFCVVATLRAPREPLV